MGRQRKVEQKLSTLFKYLRNYGLYCGALLLGYIASSLVFPSKTLDPFFIFALLFGGLLMNVIDWISLG